MKKDKGMVTCGYRGVCNTLHTGDTAGNREFLSKTLRLIGEHPCRSRHSAYCWPRCPCLRFSRLWSRVCFRAFSTTTYRYQPKICQLYGKKDSFRLLWTKRANTRSFLYLVKLIDLLSRQFFAELEIERMLQKCLFDYNFFNRHRCHKPESRLNWKYARNC